MRVEIFGHSDDCVVVFGDLSDEFGAYGQAVYLHFDDGTVVGAEYAPDDSYFWRIWPVKIGEGTKCDRKPGTYDGEDGRKCDKLVLTGDLKHVNCWGSPNGPTRDEIETWFENVDLSALTTDQVSRIMAITQETHSGEA